MRERSITVVIADDHRIIRESLALAIEDHEQLSLAGVAIDGDEALELIRAVQPDVAVVDVFMPGMTGDRILEALRHERSRVKVLILTAGPTTELRQTIALQPDSLLYKDVGCGEICEEVVAVANGAHTSHGQVTLARAALIAGPRPRLGSREIEALDHLAAGLLLKEIATSMGTSKRTIDEYLRLAREKLDVPTSAAAVARAYEMGHLRRRIVE